MPTAIPQGKISIWIINFFYKIFLAPVLDETTQAQLVLRNLAEIGKRIPDLAAILNPTLPPGKNPYPKNSESRYEILKILNFFSDTAKNSISCESAIIATTSFDNSATSGRYGSSTNKSQIEQR